MSILSIQSHVVYGYVGNKAAVYPLQNLGYDVWPINTVQFSNHTGYGQWQGEIYSASQLAALIDGLAGLAVLPQCQAILSGYMGSQEICHVVQDTVKRLKKHNVNLLYLCDPVIGNNNCYVRPEVLEFFQCHLSADIITPNQFEAEVLSGSTIDQLSDLRTIATKFHQENQVNIVIITGVKIKEFPDNLLVFISQQQKQQAIAAVIETVEYQFSTPVNGTGDLFSAIYLGQYLKIQDPILALQYTVYHMSTVLQQTQQSGSRELKVLAGQYNLPLSNNSLPKVRFL